MYFSCKNNQFNCGNIQFIKKHKYLNKIVYNYFQ
jgi:hypothetical protein